MPRTQPPRGAIRTQPTTLKSLARVKGRINGTSMDETLRVLMACWDAATADARHKAIAKVRMPKGGAA